MYERVVRCDSRDTRALIGLFERVSAEERSSDEPASGPAVHYNAALNRQILFREMYRFDVAFEEREQFQASALAVGPDGARVAREAAVFGSDYRRLHKPERAQSTVPTYLLSGRFDPLDPPSWAEAFVTTLTEGRLVEVEWAGHSTLRYLGYGEGGCGRRIFSSFLSGEPEFECMDHHPEADLGQEAPATREMIASWWGED